MEKTKRQTVNVPGAAAPGKLPGKLRVKRRFRSKIANSPVCLGDQHVCFCVLAVAGVTST